MDFACFAAGGGVSRLEQRRHPLEQRQALLLGPDMCAAWEALEQVTICAIEGYCLGGAMALAVSCDWRVCAEDALLRLPEIPLGINMSWQANPRITVWGLEDFVRDLEAAAAAKA